MAKGAKVIMAARVIHIMRLAVMNAGTFRTYFVVLYACGTST